MPFTNLEKVASWYMAAAIDGIKNIAAEDVVRSKPHAARLRMVRSILFDEGKEGNSDASIGAAMLLFYNRLAGKESAPAWGPEKYAWLLPAFFASAAAFPDGFGSPDDLIPLHIHKEQAAQRKQAEKQAKQAQLAKERAALQQEKAKDAQEGNRKRKAARAQTSARPQQRWRKGVNL